MFYSHTFENGLTLLAEPMENRESVSGSMYVPCGSNHDPVERAGLAEMLCEMVFRGAGPRSSRELIQTLDGLGCDRTESVSGMHTFFGVSLLASHLPAALEILADILLRPRFPKESLEESRLVLLNELQAIEDDPARRALLELDRNFYPDPWGRLSYGTAETIASMTLEDLRRHHEMMYEPNGAVLSIAGRFDWRELLDITGRLFGTWKKRERPPVCDRPVGRPVTHLPFDSAQTHIALAFPTVPFAHPDYLKAWCVVGILSGGMSSRLFHEIREKRGLCYAVSASYSTLPHLAGVFCYCGTSSERARESLDVLIAELRHLARGVDEDELARLRIRGKSALVMQQESTAARSAALARDWIHLGRIRPIGEIETAINRLDREDLNAFLADHPVGPLTLVTLGPQALNE